MKSIARSARLVPEIAVAAVSAAAVAAAAAAWFGQHSPPGAPATPPQRVELVKAAQPTAVDALQMVRTHAPAAAARTERKL